MILRRKRGSGVGGGGLGGFFPLPTCGECGIQVLSAGEGFMAEYMQTNEFQASRAFSPAVITQGGRTVWLAGQTATRDEQGNDISGNFDAQVHAIFDPRHGDRFVELRKATFPDGNYPASALITVSHFARPGMLIEIQGVGVIGG
jgi:2-iminobutanoate/2-iminopropanoate deaminase